MINQWNSGYDDYLRDESRRVGTADSISFPTSESEIVDIIKQIRSRGGTVTAQGARTGLAAGAVPRGGHVLNLSRMNAIGEITVDEGSGEHRIKVQPGAILSDVWKAVEKGGLFFPPDPTETSASIGGMVSCNASGALSYSYGPTRRWVHSIRMVLSDGDTVEITRGQCFADGRSFSLKTEDGRVIAGELPTYTVPPVKCAAAYYVADDMDLVDLFIGMEGTLGIVTEIELKLMPAPKAVNGLTVFLPSEETALQFVRILRGEEVDGVDQVDVHPVAIEFFNGDSLNLLRRMKSNYPAFEKIPALKPDFHTAVNIEFHGESDDELEEPIMQVMEILTALDLSDENTWFATTERELEPLRSFRHAVPEAVNLLIDERKRVNPELTKLGTDMSVPNAQLNAVMDMYNSDLKESGLESVIFGHIGCNHVHVNILPNDFSDYERGMSLYLAWAKRVVEMGGCVAAEHGIGKIKIPFLELMYGPEAISEMRALKLLFDPEMILNPGNLF